MASSRHMRRSRRSSPLATSMYNDQPIKDEVSAEYQDENLLEEWNEPPLRAPAPSFEDYKGLERHGVLEHMAPLGSLPGTKVKARLKQYEGPRRGGTLKNGDAKAAKEDVNTPEPALLVTARRSEPRKADEKPSKISSLRERDTDHEYTPEGSVRSALVKASPTQAARHGNSSSRTAEGQTKLEKIVNSAVLRATELGDQVLGIAVKQLYEESLHNQELAKLLDAVLTQKPSPSQTNQFQSYIKAARKKIRAGEVILSQSQPPSKSPTAKSSRTSVTRNFGSPPIAPISSHLSSNATPRTSRQHMNIMECNGSSSKDERPAKRIKRSMSVSSDSSLSSLDSALENSPPPLESIPSSMLTQSSIRRTTQFKPQPSMGPRLGSFSTRPSDPSTRRPIISSPNPAFIPAVNSAVDTTEQRKQLLKKNFSDFISRDSAIRTSPSPSNTIQPAPVTVLAERGQARLRNGTSSRARKEEYEALDSPTSSNYGELLVPPPPGAARGGTPNQLGRPRKEGKKAARIKIS